MSSINLSDDDIIQLLLKEPERVKRIQCNLTSTVTSEAIPEKRKLMEDISSSLKKSKEHKSSKADVVEQHIQEIFHLHYDSVTKADSSPMRFNFKEQVDSTFNKNTISIWKEFLLKKKPEKYKYEDWSDKRLNSRIKQIFRSKKSINKLSPEKKNVKTARDRRYNRLRNKKSCRTQALKKLAMDNKIPLEKYHDILLHIENPSDEETDSESDEKKIKVAISEYRSRELKDYYNLIDAKRASARKGGELLSIRLPRTDWPSHIHQPPKGAAPWTLAQGEEPNSNGDLEENHTTKITNCGLDDEDLTLLTNDENSRQAEHNDSSNRGDLQKDNQASTQLRKIRKRAARK